MSLHGLRIYGSTFKDGAPSEDVYFSRLIKLIPGEIVALYTFGIAIFKGDMTGQIVCAAASLVALLILRSLATRSSVSGNPQWPAVVISAISFIIWLFVLGGPIEDFFKVDSRMAAFIMALWVTVLPYLYPGSGTP